MINLYFGSVHLLILLISHALQYHINFARLDGVMLTTGKDTRVFEKSINSSLTYMIDVSNIYVITPDAMQLKIKLQGKLGDRVIFIDENIFPFSGANVSEIMIETVRQKGVYPLSGKTTFEYTVWGRIGWFLQQLLKLYAGKVLRLDDFVLLDSDIVWFKNISLVNSSTNHVIRYNYVTSTQYHPPYIATLKRISGLNLFTPKKGEPFRSGVCHHMVIVKSVMEDLMNHTERRYGGLPFCALEMTCRAPRLGICGAGSTLSEYELYFNFARLKYPQTVNLRPLLWANGPMPGLLFWPPSEHQLSSDGPKSHWLGHRQVDVMEAFDKQISADRAQGYDFVAYHGYSKRRYFEVIWDDIDVLCMNVSQPSNSTCSWKGFPYENANQDVVNMSKVQSWFKGCACYMAYHPSGP